MSDNLRVPGPQRGETVTDTKTEKPNPTHIRQDFYHLAVDWVHLHTQLPKPAQGANTRRPTRRESGHPAEWASDKCALIAGILHDWHALLAEHRNETPPPSPRAAETVRVTKAWKYLEPRIEQLCELVDTDDLKEIAELHRKIRSTLGHTNPKQVLPVPCPGQDCSLRTLTRQVAVGKDLIICGSCGYTVREDYYPMLVRIALDTLVDAL